MKTVFQFSVFSSLLILLLISGCKKDDPIPIPMGTFNLEIIANVDGEKLVYNEENQHTNGHYYTVSRLMMYLSNLSLVKSDNSVVKISDVELIDFENNHKVVQTEGEVLSITAPAGTYKGFRYDIGVDESLNHADPTTYEVDHPLSFYQNTHWDWNSGYRFYIMEGRMDTSRQAGTTKPFNWLYHVGTDSLFRSKSFTVTSFNLMEDSTVSQKLFFDVNKVFSGVVDTVDLYDQSNTHTTDDFPLALELTDNFINAFYLE